MDIAAIKQAQQRIKPYVKRTTLEHSETLSKYLGTNVFVKLELFQKTGSFKVRGAFNKLLSLSAEERKRGVVASVVAIMHRLSHTPQKFWMLMQLY